MVIEHRCPLKTQYQDTTASMQHPHNVIIQAAATVINSDSILPLYFQISTTCVSLLDGHKRTLLMILGELISKRVETVIQVWNQ